MKTLFCLLALCLTFSVHAQQFYCLEDYVADAPAWKLFVDGNKAHTLGMMFIIDVKPGDSVKFTFEKTKKAPIGNYMGSYGGKNIAIELDAIDVINSRPGTTVYKGKIYTYTGNTDVAERGLTCEGRPLGMVF